MNITLELKKEELRDKLDIPTLDTGDQIVKKVNDATEKIDASRIKNLPEPIQPSSGGARGIYLYANGVKKGIVNSVDFTGSGVTHSVVNGLPTLTIGGGAGTGDMLKSENLSGLADYPTARTNLGLGTLATQNGTFSGTSSGTNTGDQSLTNTSDATSHTATLSASGGSLKLVEGANITLTTTGTASDGVVTIASTGGGASAFTSLSDVPATYIGANSRFVKVNAGATGLEFVAGGGGGGTVDTIVAGNNIAVDATDPANPIVSAYFGNVEGGVASSVYLASQVITGGGA